LEIEVKAFAKINISLDVVKKRPDGWHEMKMVMQSVSLHDDVIINCRKGSGEITVKTNRYYLPTDGKNIAHKAIKTFREETGISGYDFEVDIYKRIPVCAGLGGGSADGAAVLKGLDKLFNTGLTTEKLMELGKKLGSDVPFCVMGGTALALGTGTELKRLKSMPECDIVICKPAFSVSTPALFSKLDCGKIKCRPDTNGILKAIEDGDVRNVAMRVYNVFEDVLPRGREKVDEIKSAMFDFGALGACMTGTGSAVFGIFPDRSSAQRACETLKKDYRECFVCKTVDKMI